MSFKTIVGRSDGVFWWFPVLSDDQEKNCCIHQNYLVALTIGIRGLETDLGTKRINTWSNLTPQQSFALSRFEEIHLLCHLTLMLLGMTTNRTHKQHSLLMLLRIINAYYKRVCCKLTMHNFRMHKIWVRVRNEILKNVSVLPISAICYCLLPTCIQHTSGHGRTLDNTQYTTKVMHCARIHFWPTVTSKFMGNPIIT